MLIVVLAGVGAVFAIVQVVLALRVGRTVPDVASIDAPTPAAWPRLSIIVPARDEAAGIEAALASKLACGYPELEIVVVDDRSTDDTGAIAARLASADSRLAVTRVDVLPDGWLGKVHAMSVGVARATGDWLLLSDADVHIEPGTIERVIAHAEAHALDMVALMPQMEQTAPVLDACITGMVRMLTLGGRAWAANDDRSTVGVGVGAFNLVRRSALAATPGLGYLRMEMVDDVALGAMLKASGARCRFFAARRAVHLVFAPSVSVLARGLEKGGGITGFSVLRSLLVVPMFIGLDLGLPIAAIATGGLASVLGVIQLAMLTATHALAARHFASPMRGAWLWPLGTVLGAVMLARSGILACVRDGIVWRGTHYGRAQIDAGRRWKGGRVRLEPEAAGG